MADTEQCLAVASGTWTTPCCSESKCWTESPGQRSKGSEDGRIGVWPPENLVTFSKHLHEWPMENRRCKFWLIQL